MKPSIENLSSPWAQTIHLLIVSLFFFILIPGVIMPAKTRTDVSVTGTSERQARTAVPRRVFVRSKSLLVRAAVVEDKLLKRPEFTDLGFVITREAADADIVLELRHDLLTKYVFSVIDVRTQTIVASGKLSSVGGTVAGKVAKRFVKAMATRSTT